MFTHWSLWWWRRRNHWPGLCVHRHWRIFAMHTLFINPGAGISAAHCLNGRISCQLFAVYLLVRGLSHPMVTNAPRNHPEIAVIFLSIIISSMRLRASCSRGKVSAVPLATSINADHISRSTSSITGCLSPEKTCSVYKHMSAGGTKSTAVAIYF